VWSSHWNDWQGKSKYSEKTYCSATFSTTNPWHGMAQKPKLVYDEIVEIIYRDNAYHLIKNFIIPFTF
jgi:hypothetical protein